MIAAQQLSKTFAGVYALRDLSFTIQPGEIVGFLGQNGAGKSTTMRLLAGCLAPSSGSMTVAGFDLETHSHEARQRLGYLPESVPLYPEMRVLEYLKFRARLKGVSSRGAEIERVIQKAALTEHRQQIIGTLSKGYRQRVGLADALLGKPPILLLDEPTEGLDPAQIRATRELIQSMSKEHTILLSTHILSEVERLCTRVLLLHKGRLVADLLRGAHGDWRQKDEAAPRGLWLRFDSPPADLVARVSAIKGVATVQADNDACTVHFTPEEDPTDAVVSLCAGFHLRELRPLQKRSLEEIFLSITTKEAV